MTGQKRRPRSSTGRTPPPRKRERLHKYIAGCGYCSRRRAEVLIANGLVMVNGKMASEAGTKIAPDHDQITIHGERIVSPPPLSIALNKPAGYITSTRDTHNRVTVMDLLPRKVVESGVLPAGRLDLDTEGLLILTNDGNLQHRITHPRYMCNKVYRAHLNRPPSTRVIERLTEGIYLEKLRRRTAGAVIHRIHLRKDGTATLEVIIHEGMKRQVRRMFETVGIEVLHLRRMAVAGVTLRGLNSGEWWKLTEAEITSLLEPSTPPGPRRRTKKKPSRR